MNVTSSTSAGSVNCSYSKSSAGSVNCNSSFRSTTLRDESGIYRSFEPNRRAGVAGIFAGNASGDRPISYGDRLFARIMMHGRTVVEFMVNSVNDLSELWGELRRKCRGMRGLARLYVRNASRGWSMERPLMLYPERRFATTPQPDRIAAAFRGEPRQLSFPWEL